MATSNPFESQNITLERNKVITVTKRTVRFSKNVFQTHNIASFGEGEVAVGQVPWVIVVALLFLGAIAVSFADRGGFLFMLGIAGGAWNIYKPKHYGLLLTLNSGDKKLFTTSDTGGLKRVISVIYDFIETETDATYQISINHSKVEGNFIQGSAKDVSFHPTGQLIN